MASRPQLTGPGHQLLTEVNQVDTNKTLSGPDNLVIPEIDGLPWEMTTKNELDPINTSNIIWVPAAKHPQIAPTEFLEWIKTHGNATTYNKNPVRRQRSVLSVTYTSSEDDDDDDDEEEEEEEDDDDDDDCPSTHINLNTMDSNIPDQVTADTSPVLANQSRQSLSRQKALSYRGQINTSRATSIPTKHAGQPSDINNDINGNRNITNDNTNNTKLDKTKMRELVIVNELVDLGPAAEMDSSHQLLQGMHSVETHLLTSTPETASSSLPTRKRNELRRSVSDRFSWISHSDKKKRLPWIRGFFDKYRRVDDESTTRSIPSPKPLQRSSSHNLLSYLSRKLSLSSTKSTDNPPRRRYSNFLHHTKKYQPEVNDTTDEHRLPLHLERGVYRLSHIKLSNPRRPLREQVIISNFMFWYLSIINLHPHQIQAQPHQQPHFIQRHDTNPLAPSSLQTDHAPLKRPSSTLNPADSTQISTAIPTSPSSPLSSKSKKNKYKPIRNLSFGNTPIDSTPCQ